jgi:hypothetical protein
VRLDDIGSCRRSNAQRARGKRPQAERRNSSANDSAAASPIQAEIPRRRHGRIGLHGKWHHEDART